MEEKNNKGILIIIVMVVVVCLLIGIFVIIKNNKKVNPEVNPGTNTNTNTNTETNTETKTSYVFGDSTEVKNVVLKIEGEFHLLQVSSKEIKDLHTFKNTPKDDSEGILFLGFSNNKGYFLKDEGEVYYFDLNTHEETKWMTIEVDEADYKYIEEGLIINDVLYYGAGGNILASISLDAKSLNEKVDYKKLFSSNKITSFSNFDVDVLNDYAFDTINNKMYFLGRDDSTKEEKMYIYELDINTKKFTKLFETNQDESNINYIDNNLIIQKFDETNDKVSLLSYNLTTKETITIKDSVYEVYKYDDRCIMYMPDNDPNNFYIYNVRDNKVEKKIETIDIDLARNCLPYKNSFCFDEVAKKVSIGGQIINKSDVKDTFTITTKDNKTKEVNLNVFYAGNYINITK